jgi:hypothetical protein
MQISWPQILRFWYLFSIGVIVAALPFSKLLISIGQFMLIGGWITERFDYRSFTFRMKSQGTAISAVLMIPRALLYLLSGIYNGFRAFFRHRPALLFSSIFLMHILGLFFTTDFDYAFKDLRTKLPLLIIPLVLSTSATIGEKAFFRYLGLIVLAVLVRSLFNGWLIWSHEYVDLRDVSRNISHIIFSLLLALSVFICGYSLISGRFRSIPFRIISFLLILWFLVYLIVSQSFTGISIIIGTLFLLIPFFQRMIKNRLVRGAGAFMVIIAAVLAIIYIHRTASEYNTVHPIDIKTLDQVTSRGNPYVHNYFSDQTENGHRMWLYVQWDEMRETWNRRSRIGFDSLDRKNQKIYYTIVRYLTSKGWRKDGDAIDRLTDKEVDAIEKGVANYIFLEKFSLKGRIYEFMLGYETYQETGNPTGSSIMQRIEFWKASLGIIRDHWVIGVGTGDMNEAFAIQYEKMGTKLDPGQRWRSHNQFLSIFIGFGIFGLLWFIAALWLPPLLMGKSTDYFVIIILTISSLAMLAEDTIESQTGVTFVVMFYSLFLFARFSKMNVEKLER